MPPPASYYFSTLKTKDYREHRNGQVNIRDLAWSASGNRIACALSDKLVRVWNPEKPELRHSTELKGHLQSVGAVAWDPTYADRLASGSNDGFVRLWDYRSKRCEGAVQTSVENVALAYHPDGDTLAVATKDEKVHFISMKTNSIMETYEPTSAVHDLIFSHAGTMVLLATWEGKISLLDWPSLRLMHQVEAHSSPALCLELDPRSAHLAVGGSDAVLGLWDTQEWICMRTLRGMDSPVRTLSFSYDGAYICAGSDEAGSSNIDITNVDTGESVHVHSTNHPVTNVAWHPHKYWLAYSGDPSGLKILGAAGPDK